MECRAAARRRAVSRGMVDDGEQPTEDMEHFARWSRDALVAVGRGRRMERDIHHRWRRFAQMPMADDGS